MPMGDLRRLPARKLVSARWRSSLGDGDRGLFYTIGMTVSWIESDLFGFGRSMTAGPSFWAAPGPRCSWSSWGSACSTFFGGDAQPQAGQPDAGPRTYVTLAGRFWAIVMGVWSWTQWQHRPHGDPFDPEQII